MRSKSAFHCIAHAFAGIDRDRTGPCSQRSFNGSTRTFRRALSTPHGLLPSDYRDQRPEHRAHAVRGHRGRRPLSLKKCGQSEARRAPQRRLQRLARQRLAPGTPRGRPGARHPPLRGDSATPYRLPAALHRRLDHDGQAPCTRPERAFSPGSFALAQPTWAGGAAGQLSRRRAAVASAGEVRSSKGCGVGAGAVAARSSTRALASRRPI